MTDALKIVPEAHVVKTGVRKTEVIAKGLTEVLADTYRLVFKTHCYHWNVEGTMFYSIHNLTEGQYEEMFKAADVLAERIRALGELAPLTLAQIIAASNVNDPEGKLSAGEMCEDLARDHERLAHRLHALVKLSGEHNDPVTDDLATARSAFHEQAVWMLRAISKG